ncbi:DPP IV N-terminal domain-containing protein [Streptomyces sp. P6-2-1]|uniref:DPP IV N-terminal domain-containing protein n=1 Tax=unclassified Streptomyces TaxID=2593676 RepID=UPI003D366CAD
MTTESLSFPRQYARSQRFTLGAPRSLTVAPDGSRIVFLRSRSGTDRSQMLWVLDVTEDGKSAERLLADPAALLGTGGERLSARERARRERARESAAGIVGYASDAAVTTAAYALSGRLWTTDLRTGASRALAVPGPVIDPRLSPDGSRIAYVSEGALRLVEADGSGDQALAAPEEAQVTYGLAEFVAAEEMDRTRGFWWAPDSARLLVARVDESPVQRWWIADPAHPDREPVSVAYPQTGTANADVRLFLYDVEGGRTEVVWDRARYPYLARVHWTAAGAPLLLVQSRDQRAVLYLGVDEESGATRMVHADEDPDWVELREGSPAWTPDGKLVRITDEGGARVLAVGDRLLTGGTLQVRSVLDVGADDVLISASAGADAADREVGEIHVHRVSALGVERVSEGRGVHSAVRGGPLTVLTTAALDAYGTAYRVLRDGEEIARLASYAETPGLTPRPVLTTGGAREIPCAVLLPSWYREEEGPLPVLMDPYGGPHGQRVVAARNPHLTSQWFAEQGFAVVVADGRGTPGPSPAWEKAVSRRLTLSLDDQVDALHGLADRFPLDLTRVAIRGWSFGGYLAALAVLRRPDVFHAGVVGAPVTDLRLYDTHYQERYLGTPADEPEVYAHNSLVTDEGLSEAREPHRPLMLIHGLVDDNVLVAHSLRLSSALLAAGRPHEFLPLSGVTHMTPQEEVAENLLLFQVDFLRRSLGLSARED